MRNVGRAWGEGCGFRERKWGVGGEDGNFEKGEILGRWVSELCFYYVQKINKK